MFAISCASPEDPTPTTMAYGSWYVDEYYVNGQEEGTSAIMERFYLERDGSFLLEDQNGFLTVGTWAATETSLTLTGEGDSGVYEFGIVYQSRTKMQLIQSIASPTAGTIEIRYLMNYSNDGSNY